MGIGGWRVPAFGSKIQITISNLIYYFINMENQPTKLDKAVKISIIVGFLIVGLSIAYYLVIYIPQRDKAKIEQQNQQAQQQVEQKQTNAVNLENCLEYENETRNKNMQSLFEQAKKTKLPVGQDSLDSLEKNYQERKDDCFKRFPQ